MYFITTMRSLEAGCDTRCVGFLSSFKEADSMVRSNAGDMHETMYEYAVIEQGKEAIYPMLEVVQWYRFVPTGDYRGYYVPIPPPEELANVCNFAIG